MCSFFFASQLYFNKPVKKSIYVKRVKAVCLGVCSELEHSMSVREGFVRLFGKEDGLDIWVCWKIGSKKKGRYRIALFKISSRSYQGRMECLFNYFCPLKLSFLK